MAKQRKEKMQEVRDRDDPDGPRKGLFHQLADDSYVVYARIGEAASEQEAIRLIQDFRLILPN